MKHKVMKHKVMETGSWFFGDGFGRYDFMVLPDLGFISDLNFKVSVGFCLCLHHYTNHGYLDKPGFI